MIFTGIAHGRVNLIGEHTDYNNGWVLPTAIPQFTRVDVEKLSGEQVLCHSEQQSEQLSFVMGHEKKSGQWIDYLQGAVKLSREQGLSLSGLRVRVASTVPLGSGLSSSAALEIAFLKALQKAFSWSLPENQMAMLAQRVENEFVGARVGIMDQMACAHCVFGEALFLDANSLVSERVPLPLESVDLVVINSGISHRLTDGGYNQRRAECEEASRNMQVASLRDLKLSDLPQVQAKNRPVVFQRVRHVLSENQRVHQAVEALKKKDLVALGQLFYESHQSMKNDYQISLPEIDLLVELCQAKSGFYGARLTGGGFGGSIVALAHKGQGETLAKQVMSQYQKSTGQKATLLLP